MNTSIVLVDDELIILESLKKMIKTSFPSIQVIGQATNGIDAYKLIKEIKPDIALIDIQMPLCNGIELIEKLKNEDLDTHYIFLTAHRQFEYAKSAISLGVDDYLVKPIKVEDLKNCIKKVTTSIEGTRTQSSLVSTYHKILPETIRHKLVKVMMGINSFNVLEEVFSDTLWKFKHSFILYMLSIEQVEPDLIDILEAQFFSTFNQDDCYICWFEEHMYFILSDSFANKSKFVSYKEIIITYLQKNVIIYESYKFKGFEKLNEICDYLIRMEEKNFYHCYTNSIINEAHCTQLKRAISFIGTVDFQRIYELMVCRKYDTAKLELLHLLEDIKLEKRIPPKELKKQSIVFIQECSKYSFLTTALVMKLERLTNKTIVTCENIDKLIQIMQYAFNIVIENISFTAATNDQAIKKVYDYCNKNYYTYINLDDIAEMIHMSKNYFCTYFKRKTGMNFYNYVTQIRMEIAKELLRNTSGKITDISTQIGISSSSHFGKIFKEYTGMTPLEYRNQKEVDTLETDSIY